MDELFLHIFSFISSGNQNQVRAKLCRNGAMDNSYFLLKTDFIEFLYHHSRFECAQISASIRTGALTDLLRAMFVKY